mmetsp:Transcript_10277/g.20721  ORF Transcript_10277/g.20721 Transcript_10277/m.20721 type:complete len:139 (-) Transcript_10277:446-862(-)
MHSGSVTSLFCVMPWIRLLGSVWKCQTLKQWSSHLARPWNFTSQIKGLMRVIARLIENAVGQLAQQDFAHVSEFPQRLGSTTSRKTRCGSNWWEVVGMIKATTSSSCVLQNIRRLLIAEPNLLGGLQDPQSIPLDWTV